jgi:uncharacterized protein DUF3298
MKRFFVSLIATILAFTAGLVTASSWNSKRHSDVAPVSVSLLDRCPPNLPQPPPPPGQVQIHALSYTAPRDLEFGQNGLRLVPERVKLDSVSLGYDIDVSFPQIVGTRYTEKTNIRKVNQLIKDKITNLYQWPLTRTEQLHFLQEGGTRNTVNFTYEAGLATDSFLAIHFIGYGARHGSDQIQESFSLNYDLTTGKQLTLSELFKPGSKYLEIISQYVIKDVSRRLPRGLSEGELAALEPEAENFDQWQITSNGITFEFATCQIAPCSEGDFQIEIPFTEFKSMLKADIPGRFDITYP